MFLKWKRAIAASLCAGNTGERMQQDERYENKVLKSTEGGSRVLKCTTATTQILCAAGQATSSSLNRPTSNEHLRNHFRPNCNLKVFLQAVTQYHTLKTQVLWSTNWAPKLMNAFNVHSPVPHLFDKQK